MKVISILEDKRINSSNILVEFEIKEYLEIAEIILNNNPYQRKKVKSSSTVYSLLRDDLKAGCVIPPIVLAITQDKFYYDSEASLKDITFQFAFFLKSHFDFTIILDGLQRTSNILDAFYELQNQSDFDGLESYYKNKIRCEFYSGIDKVGILYRMLTLNTGQTPMSFRHQIEILYSDYLKNDFEGIRLVREIDERPAKHIGEYNFKEIVDGFTSYLMRDYLTFDKTDILANIKSLEKLSKENQDHDIFKNFTKCYHDFQLRMLQIAGDWIFDQEENDGKLSGPAYGLNVRSIFDRSQSMTALGAAIGFLKDQHLTDGFIDVANSISKIHFDNDVDTAMSSLLYRLDDIRKNAPKIGNAQRAYFYYFFRELFNPLGDSYTSVDLAIENGYQRYRQNA